MKRPMGICVSVPEANMKWLLVPALLLAGCTAAPVAQDAPKAQLEASIIATVKSSGASAKATREFYESLGLEVAEERMPGQEARATLRVSDGATTITLDFAGASPRDKRHRYDDWPPQPRPPQPRSVHASWSVSVESEIFEKLAAKEGAQPARIIDGRPTLVTTDPAGFTVLVRKK